MTSATHCTSVMDVQPFHPCYIMVCNFSANGVSLPKNMMVANSTDPQPAVMAVFSTSSNRFAARALKGVDQNVWSNVHPYYLEERNISINGKELQAAQTLTYSMHSSVAAILYKPRFEKDLQIREYIRIQNDTIMRLGKTKQKSLRMARRENSLFSTCSCSST